jgi:hypothetical protein
MPEAGEHKRITRGKQIRLPASKALSIAVESLRVRFGRSLITSSSIALACAFLSFVLANHEIMKFLISLDDPGVNFILQKKGIDLESGDPGLAAREIWLVTTSMVVCLAGVSNALLMSVTERVKEIGTMKCLGALDGFIVKLFLIEALLLGTVSSLIGAVLGSTACLSISALEFGRIVAVKAPFARLAVSTLLTTALGTGLSVLAAIYPSLMAARMQPVEAMRKEV